MSVPSTAPTADAPAGFLSRRGVLNLVFYNVALMVVLGAGLYLVIAAAARVSITPLPQPQPKAIQAAPPDPAPAADTSTAPGPDSAATQDSAAGAAPVAEPPAQAENPPATVVGPAPPTPLPTDPRMIAYVLFAITMAGGLGGALCNLRGIFEFTRDNQGRFPSHLELAFYLRPVSGVLCGLFTFFVSTFFAGALSQGDGSGWRTLDGMFPYIGIAFLAGFASQEFMERLKDTARTLFGSNSNATDEPAAQDPVPVVVVPETGKTESLKNAPERGGQESVSRTAEPPPQQPVIRSGPRKKMAD